MTTMMGTNNYGYFIKACFLSLALSVSGAIHAADDDEIIEFQGDRYVIHVDRMNPDGEMTLMDVLNTCPPLHRQQACPSLRHRQGQQAVGQEV